MTDEGTLLQDWLIWWIIHLISQLSFFLSSPLNSTWYVNQLIFSLSNLTLLSVCYTRMQLRGFVPRLAAADNQPGPLEKITILEISQLVLSSFLLVYYLKIFHWKYFAGIWLIWIHVFTFGLVLYSMKKVLNSLLKTVARNVVYSMYTIYEVQHIFLFP